MVRNKLSLIPAGLLVFGLLQSVTAMSAIKVTRIPAPLVAGLIQQQFKGIKVRINNYGRRRGYSWYRGGDSYIRMPSNLGGRTYRFSFAPVNKFPYRYYANDINQHARRPVTVRARRLRWFDMDINLEERGTEVKGHCSSKSAAKRILCVAGHDRSAPDMHMYGMRVRVTFMFAPSANRRSITITRLGAKFITSRIRIGKRCTLGRGICGPLGQLKNRLEKEVTKRLVKHIKQDRIRRSVANALQPHLARRGIRNITHVTLSGNNLIILHR